MPELPPPPEPPPPLLARLWSLGRQRPRMVAGAGVAASAVVALSVLLIALRGAPPQPELLLPQATPAASPTSVESAQIYVHAAGAVAEPGLYRLQRGARVADLLEAAGGPAGDASVDGLNLAARLEDGQRVYVPRVGEVDPAAAVGERGVTDDPAMAGQSGLAVNLNTATQTELEELPGVGPSTALAILDYRKRNGRFRAVDELLEVRGIGPAKFEGLKDLVTV